MEAAASAGAAHKMGEEEGRFVRDATEERYDQSAHPHLTLDDLDPDAISWLRGLIANRRPAEANPSARVRSQLIRCRSVVVADVEM